MAKDTNDLNNLYLESSLPGIIKLDPSDAQPIYVGTNFSSDADDADIDWIIKKLTYDGTAVTVIQTKRGSWTGRAALFS